MLTRASADQVELADYDPGRLDELVRSSGSLWLYTFARNYGARAFYERNGFVAIAFGFEPKWQLRDVKYQWVGEPRGPRRQEVV